MSCLLAIPKHPQSASPDRKGVVVVGVDNAFVPETVGAKEEYIVDVRGSDVGLMSTTSTLEDGIGSDKDGDAFDSKWC